MRKIVLIITILASTLCELSAQGYHLLRLGQIRGQFDRRVTTDLIAEYVAWRGFDLNQIAVLSGSPEMGFVILVKHVKFERPSRAEAFVDIAMGRVTGSRLRPEATWGMRHMENTGDWFHELMRQMPNQFNPPLGVYVYGREDLPHFRPE